MKQTIRLRESELRHMISESVRRVLNESGETMKGGYTTGRAYGRSLYNDLMGKGTLMQLSNADKRQKNPYFAKGATDQMEYEMSKDSTPWKSKELKDKITDTYETLEHIRHCIENDIPIGSEGMQLLIKLFGKDAIANMISPNSY